MCLKCLHLLFDMYLYFTEPGVEPNQQDIKKYSGGHL